MKDETKITDQFVNIFTNLEFLDIFITNDDDMELWIKLIQKSEKTLRTLNVSFLEILDSSFDFLKNITFLKTFKLLEFTSLFESRFNVGKILMNLPPSVENLDLIGVHIPENCLQSMTKMFPKLKKVDLYKIGNELLSVLKTDVCRVLQEVISSNPSTTVPTQAQLQMSLSLTVLTVDSKLFIKEIMVQMVHQFPFVKSFCVRLNNELDFKVLDVISRWSKLKSLALESENNAYKTFKFKKSDEKVIFKQLESLNMFIFLVMSDFFEYVDVPKILHLGFTSKYIRYNVFQDDSISEEEEEEDNSDQEESTDQESNGEPVQQGDNNIGQEENSLKSNILIMNSLYGDEDFGLGGNLNLSQIESFSWSCDVFFPRFFETFPKLRKFDFEVPLENGIEFVKNLASKNFIGKINLIDSRKYTSQKQMQEKWEDIVGEIASRNKLSRQNEGLMTFGNYDLRSDLIVLKMKFEHKKCIGSESDDE